MGKRERLEGKSRWKRLANESIDRRTCISVDTIVSFEIHESFLWARATDRGGRRRGRRGGQRSGKAGRVETL